MTQRRFFLVLISTLFIVFHFQVFARTESIMGTVPNGANMRSAPSSNGAVVFSIPAGASVSVVGLQGGQSVTINSLTSSVWYLLSYTEGENAIEGYVWSGLVKVDAEKVIPRARPIHSTAIHIEPNTLLFFEDSYSQDEIARYVQVYTATNNYILSLGLDLESLGELPVFVYHDRAKQVQSIDSYFDMPSESNPPAPYSATYAWDGHIFCQMGFAYPDDNRCYSPSEYFRAIFLLLSGWNFDDELPDIGWITDGSALYMGVEALTVSGADFELATLAEKSGWLSGLSIPCQLSLDEPCNDDRHLLGAAAMAYLVNITGNNNGKVLEFFAQLQKYPTEGDTWHQAFQDVFGMTVSEFFDSFHDYRLSLTPSQFAEDYYNVMSISPMNKNSRLMASGCGFVP